MKKNLFLPLLAITLSTFYVFEGNLLDFHHLFGRCSGSNSYCSACSNCSSCKNCSVNGGSCAVCYTPKLSGRRTLVTESNTPVHYSRKRSTTSPKRRAASLADRDYLSEKNNPKTDNFRSTTNQNSNDAERQEITDNNASAIISEDTEFVLVIALKANLRELPTTKSKIKGKVKYAELLIKIEKDGDWVKVQTLDKSLTGYIFTDLVE